MRAVAGELRALGGVMAIYSTFFLAKFGQLTAGFPGWKIPLPEPVTRTFVHPLFREEVTITTREPEWPDMDPEKVEPPEYGVVAIQGDYLAYLESRIPAFVQALPHWCGKSLTALELDPLAALVSGDESASLEAVLFAHPSRASTLDVLPEALVSLLANGTEMSIHQLAQRWAAAMSDPQFTHSVSGERVEPDWTRDDAMAILRPMRALAVRREQDQQMYLLTEA